jgi:hypothetical protein
VANPRGRAVPPAEGTGGDVDWESHVSGYLTKLGVDKSEVLQRQFVNFIKTGIESRWLQVISENARWQIREHPAPTATEHDVLWNVRITVICVTY